MTTLALNELSRSMRERLGLDPAAERVLPESSGSGGASACEAEQPCAVRTSAEGRAVPGNPARIGTLSTGVG